MGSTDPSTAKTVALSDFISINHVAGKTSIADVDTGAVKGGIAVTAVTGLGTWAYSIDNGVNFMPIENDSHKCHGLAVAQHRKDTLYARRS